MSETVIGADFVRKILQGSANADRMRSEIDLIIPTLLSLIPDAWPVNKNSPDLCFECSVGWHNYTWISWSVQRMPLPSDVFFFSPPKPGLLYAALSASTAVCEEDADLFERTLYVSSKKCTVPLEHLLIVYQYLPVLIEGLIKTFGWESELGKKLRLLMTASEM